MTIKAAYEKYQVPPNLQTHMLRVTGIAKIIAESWQTKNLDLQTIVNVCLLHDISNLLKFDLVNPDAVSFLGPEAKNVDHWRKVQNEMRQKYGADDDTATHLICEELKVNPKSMFIIDNWGFGYFDKVLSSNNWEYKICVYSDHRIGPNRVLPLTERLENQRQRYLKNPNKNNSATISSHLSDRREMLISCAFEVEKQIQSQVSRDLSTITDEEISQNFEDFLSGEINF